MSTIQNRVVRRCGCFFITIYVFDTPAHTENYKLKDNEPRVMWRVWGGSREKEDIKEYRQVLKKSCILYTYRHMHIYIPIYTLSVSPYIHIYLYFCTCKYIYVMYIYFPPILLIPRDHELHTEGRHTFYLKASPYIGDQFVQCSWSLEYVYKIMDGDFVSHLTFARSIWTWLFF